MTPEFCKDSIAHGKRLISCYTTAWLVKLYSTEFEHNFEGQAWPWAAMQIYRKRPRGMHDALLLKFIYKHNTQTIACAAIAALLWEKYFEKLP